MTNVDIKSDNSLGHSNKKNICFVVTSNYQSNNFVSDYIDALATEHHVTLVSSERNSNFENNARLTQTQVPILREPRIFRDLLALGLLVNLFASEQFECVYSISPKAGLLAMLASKLCGIRTRSHFFTGQVWVTKSGISRWLLKNLDKLIAICATRVFVDSRSQLNFLTQQKVVCENKGLVIAGGSVSGVDISRYKPSIYLRDKGRNKYQLTSKNLVFLFLGRLHVDKGLRDFITAFAAHQQIHPNSRMMIVGPDEGEYDVLAKQVNEYALTEYCRFSPATRSPEFFYNTADVFVMPSYREGFGTSVLEAAACGIPSIGSRIYGLVDAIDEGNTGLLYEPKNIKGLVDCLNKFAEEVGLVEEMGAKALKRAVGSFSSELMVHEFMLLHRATK